MSFTDRPAHLREYARREAEHAPRLTDELREQLRPLLTGQAPAPARASSGRRREAA